MVGIPELPLAGALAGTETVPVVQAGETRRTTVGSLAAAAVDAVSGIAADAAAAAAAATAAAGSAGAAAAAAGAAAADATAASAQAAAAAASLTHEMGALVQAAAGVQAGIYFAAASIPRAFVASRFYGRVLAGTGTATVTVLDDGVAVVGPVVIGSGGTDTAIAFTVAQHSDVQIDVASVTGTVTSIIAKIEGIQA